MHASRRSLHAVRVVTISCPGNQALRSAGSPSSSGPARIDHAACRTCRSCGSASPHVGGSELASHSQPSGHVGGPAHARGRQYPHPDSREPSCTGESPGKRGADRGAGDGLARWADFPRDRYRDPVRAASGFPGRYRTVDLVHPPARAQPLAARGVVRGMGCHRYRRHHGKFCQWCHEGHATVPLDSSGRNPTGHHRS